MFFKTTLFLLLSDLVLIQGVTYCCNGSNIVNDMHECLEGDKIRIACTDKVMIPETEETVITNNGELNLTGSGLILPVDEYCGTSLEATMDVYIICYKIEEVTENDEITNILTNINTYLQLVSIFFIALTVIVYLFIPENLALQEICVLHSISGLALAYLAFVIVQLSGVLNPVACHFLAYWGYFFTMYCCFWLNASCFHIWRNVINVRSLKRINCWKTISYVYCIGASLLALAWVMLVNHGNFDALSSIHPGIGYDFCWFKSIREAYIFFYAPMTILIIINIILFVWTAVELWNTSKNCVKTKAHKYRLRLLFKLFFLMGLQWIFEIISAAFVGPWWIWMLTDILNAAQGLLIFLILVVFRKKMKRTLANRKICGCRLPYQWRNERDSECDELEEVEYTLEEKLSTKNDTCEETGPFK